MRRAGVEMPKILTQHRITDKEDIYFAKAWEIYAEAFPLCEQRSYDDHVRALEDNSFYSNIYLDENNEALAILFYWELEQSYFAEFFAIAKNKRSLGLGTKILKEYFLSLPKVPVLEIENIVEESTFTLDEQKIKRWKFYERLGFCFNDGVYHHPPYQEAFDSFELNILSYQRKLNAQEYAFFIEVDKLKPLTYTHSKGELQSH